MTDSKKGLCVTFDLWQTLIVDRPDLDVVRNRLRYEGIHQVLSDLGLRISLEDLRDGFDRSAYQLQEIWRTNKELSTLEQVRLVLKAAGLNDFIFDSETATKLETAYVDPLLASPPEPNPDAIATLQDMRSRVHAIGLISNTGRSPGTVLRELLRRYDLFKFFDTTIFSNEIGSRKPEKHIFERAAVGLQTQLANVVHIGDDPEADVWGAKQAGMKAVLLDYAVPEGFRKQPTSLFRLARTDRRIPDYEIRPDRKIKSLREAVDYIDALT